ncbi:MAG: glycoside hydrolase family 99-like domain-containing protein [Lachnospiraceae bacterium]|nr:glycoside hydrolase family 99-like domain-containing protein [Lachnospiraceae bacterium]
MRTAKLYPYIPEPQPVKSDYMIACHYYPGWKKGAELVKHNRFDDLINFPERTPLLGYYDEENPEVCDWEIKWAVEHGIGCFIHCWYRKRDNVGKKITVNDLRLAHGIHEAYFNCKFKKYMKFAIMWECQWGLISGMDDLVNNLIPFWVENYFKDEQYLTIDGKPVLYIYDMKNLINFWGSEEKNAEMIAVIHEEIKKYGFTGIHISATHSQNDIHERNRWHTPIGKMKEMGLDSIFQYCQQVGIDELTDEQYQEYLKTLMLKPEFIIEDQLKKIQDRIDYDPYFGMYTVSCMRDSRPWFPIFNIDPKKPMMQYRISPMEYKGLLKKFKEKIDKLPEDSIGRRIVVIDNWNEWSEGHYVAPCLENGFQYLQAIREILTCCDNLPDYRVPEMLNFGPYES